MSDILILEDEPALRASMAKALARLDNVTVVEAGTVREAIAAIDESPPRVIVSDIDLPDRSGVEILGELIRRGLHVPVLFVTGYLKAFGSLIPPHADATVLEKPVSIEELRRLVSERLPVSQSAPPAPFGVADYLQLAAMGRHSVVIEVRFRDGRSGSIVVQGGQLWSASDSHGTGNEAFTRLAFVSDAAISCKTLARTSNERNLHGSVDELLLEAARVADENSQNADLGSSSAAEAWTSSPVAPESAQPPPPHIEPPSADARSRAEDHAFEAAWEDGVEGLITKDYAAAYRAFRAAWDIRPGDAKVAANLKRLRDLGHGQDDGT